MAIKTEPALKRKSPRGPWQSLGIRVSVASGLIVLAFCLLWFDRGGLKDNVDGHLTFIDTVYFTMTTITTVGYGDIVPVTQRARFIDGVFITPIRLFVWLLFLGTAYEFLLKHAWERWRMARIQGKLSGHVILVGYGESGSRALDELLATGLPPAKVVVIDLDADAIDRASNCGVAILQGDASRDEILSAAHIERASALLVAAGRDDSSVLIVLTARSLAPDVKISVSIRACDNEGLARQAGADTVVNPVSFAGLLLASSLEGPHRAEYLADLATSAGRVLLRERNVALEEIGKPLSAIETGLAAELIRGGNAYCPSDPAAQRLRPGDRILEIIESAR